MGVCRRPLTTRPAIPGTTRTAKFSRVARNGLAAVVPRYESDMPASASLLSDEVIQDVLSFIRCTRAEKQRDYQSSRPGFESGGSDRSPLRKARQAA
jgi:hypothetical protein